MRKRLLQLFVVSALLFMPAASAQVTSNDPNFTVTLLRSGLSGPSNAAVFRASTGDVVVSEFGASRASTVDAASGATSLFASVTCPDEIAVRSSDGLVAVKTHPCGTTTSYGPISFFNSTGTAQGSISAGSPNACITGLAFDSGGNLFVAAGPAGAGGLPGCSSSGWSVYEFSGPTPWTATPTTAVSGLNGLEGIVFFGSDLFAISFTAGNVYDIFQVEGTFTFTTIATVPNAATTGPTGIAVDPKTGNIYVSEFNFPGMDILRVPTGGCSGGGSACITTFATGFTNPIGLGFDNAGSLYAADFGTGDLWKFSRASQTATLTFTPGAFQTQVAVFNGPPSNADAHSIKFTVTQVNTTYTINVTPFYVPTDLQNGGTTGAGIADGICETGANEHNDFDCRFAQFFLGPAVSGGNLVPQCYPYSDQFCVYYRVSGAPAFSSGDYTGPIYLYIAWNPTLLPRGTFAGSYQTTPHIYDDPDNDSVQDGYPVIPGFPYTPENHQFVFDVTTYYNPGGAVGDPGTGGRIPQYNDFTIAFPLANSAYNLPSYGFTWLKPVDNPNFKQSTASSPVVLTLRFTLTPNTVSSTGTGIAVTAPHHVGVAIFSGACGVPPTPATNQPIQVPTASATSVTYNSMTGHYQFNALTAFALGQYSAIISSDLFPGQCANFRVIAP